MKELRYTQRKLESGLVVPVKVQTVVTLTVVREGILGGTLTGFYTVEPSNSCYRTLVLEFKDGFTLTPSFAQRVLNNQGVHMEVLTATVHFN